MKTRVFLDTNFFMMPYKNGIDIFQEIGRLMSSDQDYEVVTLSSARRELEVLAEKGRGEDKVAARIGLELLSEKRVSVIKGVPGFSADEDLLGFAEKGRDIIVCTNDKMLKKELREKGVKVITMRSKSHLAYI